MLRPGSCFAASACLLLLPEFAHAAGAPFGECTLTCPATQSATNDPGECGADVDYPSPIIEGTCGPVVCNPPVGFFPVGTTPVTCGEQTQVDLGPAPGAACTFDVTVADTEPPAIVCPADISVQAPAGATEANVAYPFPELGDNCFELETPTCVPASGDPFPLGDTTTTCTTADGSGNSAACDFVVSVTGGTLLEVPAVSPGGLAALALLLGGAAFAVLRRRASR